jgi:hypothetical protein
MRLYYLTSTKWAKVAVAEQRLKLSLFPSVNDPFELLGGALGDRRARRVFNYVKETLAKRYGLICLSETWRSPVMWAHYGDRHTGVALGFDVPERAAHLVDYAGEKLKNLLGRKPSLGDVSEETLMKLVSTKAKDWSYERERRIFDTLNTAPRNAAGHHFLAFNDDHFALREVLLGANSDWSIDEAARAVAWTNQGIRVARVRPAFDRFEMCLQQREKVTRVPPSAIRGGLRSATTV